MRPRSHALLLGTTRHRGAFLGENSKLPKEKGFRVLGFRV